MARFVIYDNNKFPVEESYTLEEAQEALSDLYPAIADAEGKIDANGDYVFTKRAGTKGC